MKMRFCCSCGAELGFIADRQYQRDDTCGARECERIVQEMHEEERERAHDDLDERMGW